MVAGEAAVIGGTAAAVIGILLILYFAFIIFSIAFGIFSTIIWIIMLIDAIKRDYKNENDKILWILVIALTGFVGAIIYYFVIKNPYTH